MKTIKNIFNYLKSYFTYVRILKLYKSVILDCPNMEFKQFILCSNFFRRI
jgi:hypothetical protein